jgi:hypothetical protein
LAFPKSKAQATEREFPHVVEITLPAKGLDIQLSRQIATFHSLRDIRLRFGQSSVRNHQQYCRYCFSDPATADAFQHQFGGVRVPNRP